jgi:GH24 family phage-related lysozyme (muramidase)
MGALSACRRFGRWLPLLLMAVCLPAAAQEAQAASCRPMGTPEIYGLTAIVLLGSFVALAQIDRRLRREGWSLANAVSEPTRLQVPADPHWLESMGDREAAAAGRAPGAPETVILLEPSISRLIALVGMVVILMMYLGFGIFILFSFGFTCAMPAASGAVTGFLYSGLTLFAPYVANQFSKVFQPLARQAGATTPAPPSTPSPPSSTFPLPSSSLLPSTATPPATATSSSSPRTSSTSTSTRTSATTSSTTSATHPSTPPQAPSRSSLPPRAVLQQTSPAPAPVDPLAPALALIREFEGFVDQAYPDPASGAEPWTIGYGFTTVGGVAVTPGQTITQAAADRELVTQAQACAANLAGTIPYWAEMNGNQRCALIDFAWNLGQDFYGDEADFASISRDLRTRAWSQVPQTLCLYCDPGTNVSDGLLRRRQAEGQLWQQPETAAAHRLQVPYFDQLKMADGQGYRECFSASSAMLAAFWGKEPNEDTYDSLRQCYGDSTSSEAQLQALRSLGLQADSRTDGTVAMLKAEIDAGRPVAVGWLCDGPVSAPSGGGHWSVIVGYDATGFFINDPNGNCDLVEGGYDSHDDGAGLHYSYRNWVPRWRPQDTGGWLLTCRR